MSTLNYWQKRLIIQYETNVTLYCKGNRSVYLVHVHLGENMQKAANILFTPSELKHDITALIDCRMIFPGGFGHINLCRTDDTYMFIAQGHVFCDLQSTEPPAAEIVMQLLKVTDMLSVCSCWFVWLSKQIYFPHMTELCRSRHYTKPKVFAMG